VLFDPRRRKKRTTYHCAFDESLHERRCGLLDYTLRPRKAGPGASHDEERNTRLEGELYDPEGNFIDNIVDDKDAGFPSDVKVRETAAAVSAKRGAQG